jgi:hypothetical protein
MKSGNTRSDGADQGTSEEIHKRPTKPARFRKNKIKPGQGIDFMREKIKTGGYAKRDRQARTQRTMLRSREGTKGKTRGTNKIQESIFLLQIK